MTERYMIEIYPPGETATPDAFFESPTPFLSIHEGDFIHPIGHDIANTSPGDPAHRVSAVVHLIFGTPPKHKILVYTEKTTRSPL